MWTSLCCSAWPCRSLRALSSTAGIKIHETRIIQLLEILLHAGNNLGGWSAKHIHQVIIQSFHLSEKAYALNQLRYDLRKLKGHGLLERDGTRYAYRLTSKGFPSRSSVSVLPQAPVRSTC